MIDVDSVTMLQTLVRDKPSLTLVSKSVTLSSLTLVLTLEFKKDREHEDPESQEEDLLTPIDIEVPMVESTLHGGRFAPGGHGSSGGRGRGRGRERGRGAGPGRGRGRGRGRGWGAPAARGGGGADDEDEEEEEHGGGFFGDNNEEDEENHHPQVPHPLAS